VDKLEKHQSVVGQTASSVLLTGECVSWMILESPHILRYVLLTLTTKDPTNIL
jgi:hypothetical protein